MKFLYDGPQDCHEVASQYGFEVGRLFSPLTRYDADRDPGQFAVDNGCFCGFRETSFFSMLERLRARKDDCLFVTCPDVVGSARRTLEIFKLYRSKLAGWPVAFVAQDGIENLDIPWCQIDAIFIGGTDKFKLSPEAEQVIRAGKILGKWVHVGRINSRLRWDKFEALCVDSCDGSGISRYTNGMAVDFTHPSLEFEARP